MCNLKSLGLILLTVSAIGAVAAPTVAANQFHSSSTNTRLTVSSNETQSFQYETGGETIKCTKFGVEGEISGAQTTTWITLVPTYSECTVAIPFTKVEVSMNGCYYDYTMDFGNSNTGFIEIRCPTIAKVQKQITMTIKVFGSELCTFHFSEQNPTGSYDFANNGSAQVDFTSTQYSLDGTRQGSSECGAAASETGLLSGKFQLKGEITGQQTQANFQVG